MLTFGITILCCSAFCKLFHRIREARLEHDLRPERPSIFVIPLPGSSHDHNAPHRPPATACPPSTACRHPTTRWR
ncbi:uncharacterized protein si:dkey-283b1.6 [Osmerus eperlanus]|uniref:uncharacterized protein si:dkey-283b1.6 n=1 Tax=Osmerus eperlanus TaxID=29151 RepID=UPI002E123371